MSAANPAVIEVPESNYLNVAHTVKSWLLTKDHKRIALLYLLTVTAFFFVGGAAATIFRISLVSPNGNLIETETYNRMFTLHGIVMVFLFLIPSIPAILGNFMLPLMIGSARPGFSEDQPVQLVPLRLRRQFRPLGDPGGRRRYRVDLLHSL